MFLFKNLNKSVYEAKNNFKVPHANVFNMILNITEVGPAQIFP